MVFNHQKRVAMDLQGAQEFTRRLRRTLRLGTRDFNVCFVSDKDIRILNSTYRGIECPTDVLSFVWKDPAKRGGAKASRQARLSHFLGDIVISAQTARRQARSARHSTENEIRWLILHGVLHLLGYDHKTDRGEMTALEHTLRERLGLEGPPRKKPSPRIGRPRRAAARRTSPKNRN